MRQVPNYLIIGNGRVSRHIQHYLTLLSVPFDVWHRREPLEKLHNQLEDATHVLLLISDNAIEPFAAQHLQNSRAIKLHFSGSLTSSFIYGAHPLYSFNADLYQLDEYQAIPFVIDENAPEFETLLPGLANPHARLHPSKKAKYHALCVLGGNFSTMLWQKFFSDLNGELNLPPEIGYGYLRQVTQNLLNDAQSALTGPLTRNDEITIQKNLSALEMDPFKSIYQSFVHCYQQIKNEGAV